MKIAQVAPLWENIPPKFYGGTERIIYSLIEGMGKKEHAVTLFACGNAKTSARLMSVCPRPLIESGVDWTNIMYPLLNITKAFDLQDEFDIIHIHLNKASDYISLPLAEKIKKKVVFTLHFPYPTSQNRMDRHAVLQKYKDLNYVSISDSQRKGGENLNWVATVYNGINIDHYNFYKNPEEYFVWVGKFNPDKGVLEAIAAAKKAGVKLILGGKIDNFDTQDRAYYEEKVKPHINGENICYVGELDDKKKNKYFGSALAFLNPIQWNEPFGLVMAESMASGTPVISFKKGSAPELIEDGVTGYLVDDVKGMVEKMKIIRKIKREACRGRVEKMFTEDIMVENYIHIYNQLLK